MNGPPTNSANWAIWDDHQEPDVAEPGFCRRCHLFGKEIPGVDHSEEKGTHSVTGSSWTPIEELERIRRACLKPTGIPDLEGLERCWSCGFWVFTPGRYGEVCVRCATNLGKDWGYQKRPLTQTLGIEIDPELIRQSEHTRPMPKSTATPWRNR